MLADVDHVIVCGKASAPRHAKSREIVRLDLNGDNTNIDLEILDISRRLSSDVPDVVTDLVEIATYVYCADQLISRGGEGVDAAGARWRRHFIFHSPVRLGGLWSSSAVRGALQRVLEDLSEDTYEFHFSPNTDPVLLQQYLRFEDEQPASQSIDEVLLFSGGLDSLGGAVSQAVVEKRRTALVSHRSNSKISARQKQLVQSLHGLCRNNPPLHVPVWIHKHGITSQEYTQRTRSFLYASLAFAVARIFGLRRIQFYENGVVSLNLPISEQAIGSRATRTTHPRTVRGFAALFSHLTETDFTVENPFLWLTKTQIVDLIGDAGCGPLIGDSTSCMHTHAQTRQHPHCGQCSQCVWRRFAVLASRYAANDHGHFYKVDLLTGARTPDDDLTLVESFIRVATDLGSMNEYELLQRFGEIARVLRHLAPLSAHQVAEKIVSLFKQHATEVTGVMDAAIAAHASGIRDGSLSPTCAIALAVNETYRGRSGEHVKSTDSALSRPGETNGKPRSQSDGPLREVRSHQEPPPPAGQPKEARARTVAKLIEELNLLKPQLFEDEGEYERLRLQHPDFLSFSVAKQRPDLKQKILSIQGSARHILLAQQLAAAYYGKAVTTIKDDWKDYKPASYRLRP